MTKDEALKLARRALYFAHDDGYSNELSHEAITAIKAALEAKDEPVAGCQHKRYSVDAREGTGTCHNCGAEGQMQFVVGDTTPPQRTWVGLTDEDRFELAKAQHGWEDLLIAAEAKLKEKNT